MGRMTSHIWWKIKHVPSHQPGYVHRLSSLEGWNLSLMDYYICNSHTHAISTWDTHWFRFWNKYPGPITLRSRASGMTWSINISPRTSWSSFKPVSQKHQQKLEQIDALYSTNKHLQISEVWPTNKHMFPKQTGATRRQSIHREAHLPADPSSQQLLGNWTPSFGQWIYLCPATKSR